MLAAIVLFLNFSVVAGTVVVIIGVMVRYFRKATVDKTLDTLDQRSQDDKVDREDTDGNNVDAEWVVSPVVTLSSHTADAVHVEMIELSVRQQEATADSEAAEQAAEGSAQPEVTAEVGATDWQTMTDSKTGATYYVSKSRNLSQWDKPVDLPM
jgi:hypothetical protein